MAARLFASTFVLAAIVALPAAGYAQQSVIFGTVVDTTGGVLPGVTVTAHHTATGNTFFSVTDERGAYRIPARIGVYQLTAELPGFATVSRQGVTLLVGQEVSVNLQMTPSGVEETVTVTGEAPLLNVTQSVVSGNIDSRQMEELPVQGGSGRRWRCWRRGTASPPSGRTPRSTAATSAIFSSIWTDSR
jgi:hypothetical protein